MISDDLLIYLLAQIILLILNLLGQKMPIISFIGIIGTILISVPTMISFGDYYMVALILILANILIPTVGIREYRTKK